MEKPIAERLLSVSHCPTTPLNLDSRQRLGGPTQSVFEQILEAMAMIRAVKVSEYGDSRLRLKHGEEEKELHLVFSDIHRKYIRLDNQIWKSKVYDPNALLETLADLTNYSAQAIQILITQEDHK